MARRHSALVRVGNWLMFGVLLAAFGSVTFVYVRWLIRERRYTKMITEIAPKYGLDPALVKAVMRQESRFDPFARSKTGAIGLMQVMPATGRLIGVTESQLWDERTNIEAGAWLLAHALEYWRKTSVDDPLPFALAEYNAGRPRAMGWAGSQKSAAEFVRTLPHAGVRHYIERVLKFYEEYR